MTNPPMMNVPPPPPGAALPPGYVPPPPGGSMPAPQMPRPNPNYQPAPREQAPLDPQAIRVQAAITELENQCNAVRSRCMNQAAQLAYAEAVIKQLEEQAQGLAAENKRLADELQTAKADYENLVASEPVSSESA